MVYFRGPAASGLWEPYLRHCYQVKKVKVTLVQALR